MDTSTQTDDPVLARLREEFTGHRIWRARGWDGQPGDWVATLHDPSAGVDRTVIRADPVALREELVLERQRAAQLVKRVW